MRKSNRLTEKSIKKLLSRCVHLCLAVIVLFVFTGSSVKAETMVTPEASMEVTSDGSYLYFSYQGVWSNYLNTQISVAVNGAPAPDALGSIRLNSANEGESGSFPVYNSWSQVIEGAQGSVTNSTPAQNYGYETMSWTMQVPVSIYGGTNVNTMTFQWNGSQTSVLVHESEGSDQPEQPENPETPTQPTEPEVPTQPTEPEVPTQPEQPTEPETPTQPEQPTDPETPAQPENPPVVTDSLVIDGYFGDWNGYPRTNITYLGNNTEAVHYGQIASDGENLYVHFSMNDLYMSQMQLQLWNMQINGQNLVINVIPVNGDGSMDWGNMSTQWGEGIHTNFKAYIGYYNECGSQVAFNVYDPAHTDTGKGDEIEFSLNLSKLSEITGISEEALSTATITIKNPNIGTEGVTITGTPTGAWLGVLMAMIIASAVVWKLKKEKGKYQG